MYSLCLLTFAILSVAAPSEVANPGLVNRNVDRVVDLTSQLVKITSTITLANTGKENAHNYLIVLEPNTANKLSYISVRDSLYDELPLVAYGGNNTFYSVELKQPVLPGRSRDLILELVFTGLLLPYPSKISQNERQLVRYFGSHYYYSPYATTRQTTGVLLFSKTAEDYTRLEPVSVSDSTIIYGPYNYVAPFTLDRMMVHYENNAAFLVITRLERFIEISHWGNIAVEEHIDIKHTGAKREGSSSPYNSHYSVKSYKTILPAAAHSIYYRDTTGNISTSQVHAMKNWIALELRPRFPLFGGWRCSYTLGYSLPSYQYLFTMASTQFVLRVPLLDHVFDYMHVADLEIVLVLPVGVESVQVNLPYPLERLPDSVSYKYLDTLGRLVVRLKKSNLVEQHIQDIELVYDWEPLLLFYEPVLVSAALYLIFIVVIICVRLDFSIRKQAEQPKKNK